MIETFKKTLLKLIENPAKYQVGMYVGGSYRQVWFREKSKTYIMYISNDEIGLRKVKEYDPTGWLENFTYGPSDAASNISGKEYAELQVLIETLKEVYEESLINELKEFCEL